MRMNLFPFYLWRVYPLNTFGRLTFLNLRIHFIYKTIRIMHQHAGVGNVVGMEIGNFEVVSGFGCGKFSAENTFHFAERAARGIIIIVCSMTTVKRRSRTKKDRTLCVRPFLSDNVRRSFPRRG